MKYKILGIVFILITISLFTFIGVGMHGHFMFRPHMLQDWILWGSVLFSFLIGLNFLLKKSK